MKQHERNAQRTVEERSAALSRVGMALMSELDETRLAETACELTGAEFAAFTLRPVNDEGEPLVPAEGGRFHLAAVAGVTPEQEALLRRMPLSGEGLLAPIFRHGVPVRVADALAHLPQPEQTRATGQQNRDVARQAAFDYAHGQLSKEALRSMGVPRGHPVVRSFLGVPLLDRTAQVRGGLLLGHREPGQFTQDDEALLVGLAAQAAVALENARLYRLAQRRAQELNAIFESIADGVTVMDHQRIIVRENGAARRLREQLKDTPEGERVVEALLYTPARHALSGEAVVDLPLSVVDSHNETREYLVNASPLRLLTTGPLSQENDTANTPQNGVFGAVVTWHDVTERRLRETEHQAQAHASQLETIFEAMTDGVFVYDRHGSIVQVNTAARRLLALDVVPDYTARPLEERLALLDMRDTQGQSLPRGSSAPARLLKGEVLTGANALEVQVRALDGREVQVSIGGAPLWNQEGRITGAVMTFRDMSERHRLEQLERRIHAETEARRALLQMILDELPSSVYLVHGSDARLILANRASATVWGASWPPGQPMDEFLREHGICVFGMDGLALIPEQLATLRAVRDGEMVYQQQEVIRHSDGTTMPVLVNAVALDLYHLFSSPVDATKPLAEGTEPAALVVHQDVSAMKEAERLKDEFIAIAAHELRNPLAVLKSYAQALLFQARRGRGYELADWQREALQNIDLATHRLVDLTEELLDVTRLQAGQLALHPEPTDLVALIRRVAARLQVTTERHPIAIHATQEHIVAEADPLRIEQVLGNLITNAIKYSPEGGRIDLTLREDPQADTIELCVEDQGIGIPAHQQARIFGRFERADNARKIDGTGLGLYICRALVEQHGGRIWFESLEDQGSTFFIALPMDQAVVPSM
jgi:signal transduction histidine kinase/PAS domain-containing protein